MREEEFDLLKQQMIEDQLLPRDITDELVLIAMEKVPRHKFVPVDMQENAYDDNPLPIGEGQTISQPYMDALMTELLQLKGGEKVLEIGTGSGYQAAILAEIASRVYSMEAVAELADRARSKLIELGYKNINVIVGDGTEGLKEHAPYNGIIVTAGAPSIPKPLTDQLAEGGRLVIPVGDRYSQILKVVTKVKGELKIEDSIGCMFVPLTGKFGWQ